MIKYIFSVLVSIPIFSVNAEEINNPIKEDVASDVNIIKKENNNSEDVLLIQDDNLVEKEIQVKQEEEKRRYEAKEVPVAIQIANYDRIERFLKSGGNVNLRIYNKNTIVHFTAIRKDIEYLNFANKNKADLTLINEDLQNALHIAGANGSLVYFEEFRNLVGENKFKEMLNQRDKFGRNVLQNISLNASNMKKYENLINMVIQSGANINSQDDMGQSSLHYAIILDNWSLAELLLKNKANINLKDNEGQSVQDYIKKKLNIIQVPKVYKYLSSDYKKEIESMFSRLGLLNELIPYGYNEKIEPIPLPKKNK